MARAVLVAFRVTKEQLRDDRERTGEILDRVDAWIADGVLNGEQLRTADFAVASSLALVEYILALQPELQRRPLCGLLERVFTQRRSTRSSVSLRPSSVSASTRRRKRPRRWIFRRLTTPVRSVRAARLTARGREVEQPLDAAPADDHVGEHQPRALRSAHLHPQVPAEAAAAPACRLSGP